MQRKRNENPSCESVTEYHLGTQEPNVGEYKYILKNHKKHTTNTIHFVFLMFKPLQIKLLQ